MKMNHVIAPNNNETIRIQGVLFSHKDIHDVVDDFYNRIQIDSVLQIPFRSVENWPDHIQKLTHFWWIRLGGKPYLLNHYNPVAKHYFAGFNRELLTRWLAIFHDTLQSLLNPDQTEIWKLISERMGEALFMKNEYFRSEYEHQNIGTNSSTSQDSSP